MRGPSPLYIEERHRALGRDATFSWSRALTHPPRCNRTRHRGRHLDFVGAAILVSWGPPSWTGSRGGRHLWPEVTSKALKWRLYYSPKPNRNRTEKIKCLKPNESFHICAETETERWTENVQDFDFIFFGFVGRISAKTTVILIKSAHIQTTCAV